MVDVSANPVYERMVTETHCNSTSLLGLRPCVHCAYPVTPFTADPSSIGDARLPTHPSRPPCSARPSYCELQHLDASSPWRNLIGSCNSRVRHAAWPECCLLANSSPTRQVPSSSPELLGITEGPPLLFSLSLLLLFSHQESLSLSGLDFLLLVCPRVPFYSRSSCKLKRQRALLPGVSLGLSQDGGLIRV
jgi:hypothetical protein